MNTSRPSVAIRADASTALGTGHVMRCLSLADALRSKGADVTFVCSPQPGHLGDVIGGRGYPVSWLPDRPASRATTGLPDALAIDSDIDAADTVKALVLLAEPPDWIVVDHYSLNHFWERQVRSATRRVMAIDDLTGRHHDCDLLVSPNLIAPVDSALRGSATPATRWLKGPRYALLSARYGDLHARVPTREGAVERLLIYFGDNGPLDQTGQALEALLRIARTDVMATVILAPHTPHAPAIRRLAAPHRHITVEQGLPDIATRIAEADVALGAAGSTSWERLCLGLPSLVVDLAPNQRPIARALAAHRLAEWIGSAEEMTSAGYEHALRRVLAASVDSEWSRRCRDTVDGRGADRVAAIMMQRADDRLTARSATSDDVEVAPVTEAVAKDLRRQLRALSTTRMIVVDTASGAAASIVRFQQRHDAWEIDYQPMAPPWEDSISERRCVATALSMLRVEHQGRLCLRAGPSHNPPGLSIGICTDAETWLQQTAAELVARLAKAGHRICWVHDAKQLGDSDLTLYLGYGRIVSAELLGRSTHNLVVHESDLPRGRGWSPLTWQILEGRSEITVTLFEAGPEVDSGPIYAKETLRFNGNELVDELRAAQAAATITLCESFIAQYPQSATRSIPQAGEPTYYRRRRPDDSRLDTGKSLMEQFNLLRVVDNERYPAWLEIDGHRYRLKIERA